MVLRTYLKCNVCESITMIRTQIDFCDVFPIRIYCGECRILFATELQQKQKKLKFCNASIIKPITNIKPQYYVETSAHFITKKLQKYDKKRHETNFSPFINTLTMLSEKNFMNFIKHLSIFSEFIRNDWTNIRKINEIWLNNKYKYLPKELCKYLPRKKFYRHKKLDYYRGIHHINSMFFMGIYGEDNYKKVSNLLSKEINLIQRNSLKIKQTIDMINYFDNKKLFDYFEKQLFDQYVKFVEIFNFLIPAFGLKFCNNVPKQLCNEYGMTTASFEDIKQFYLDSFEVAAGNSTFVIAFNNLKYRNNFEQMKVIRKDVNTLSQFELKNKGDKIKFIDGVEIFDTLIYPNLDNNLRNAIGHKSYIYNGVDQTITYYPSGKMNVGVEQKIYLVNFARKCIDIFISLINLNELVYNARVISLILKE